MVWLIIKQFSNAVSRNQWGRLASKTTNSNFLVQWQSVPAWALPGLPQGELMGERLQTSPRCHALMFVSCACLCYIALAEVYVFPCHSLQVIFLTIKFSLLPGCHLLPFHSVVQTCYFCSIPHVRCMRDCCQSQDSTGNRQAIGVALRQEGELLRRAGWSTACLLRGQKEVGLPFWGWSNQVNRATPSPDVSLLCPWHRGVGVGEKRGSQPCKKDRGLLFGSNATEKNKVLIPMAINYSRGCWSPLCVPITL